MEKIYNVLWKKGEANGKALWEKVGVMLEKPDGKKSLKIDMLPAYGWNGWLVLSENKPHSENKTTKVSS
ncbi:hypothetical protein H8E50_11485 [bacterium]|nr:hypothetical protein [bacterium]